MNGRQEHQKISVLVDGQTFDGNYWVAGKILVVSTAKGGASHQLGSESPEVQAKRMLRKLALDGKA